MRSRLPVLVCVRTDEWPRHDDLKSECQVKMLRVYRDLYGLIKEPEAKPAKLDELQSFVQRSAQFQQIKSVLVFGLFERF